MAQRQQYVSDVFHMLGQPLTELQMSLEMALQKKLDAPGYRVAIRQALEATRRVIQSAKFVRQLAEAEDPGTVADVVDFTAALRESIEEFEPVAECSHVEIGHIVEERLIVAADPARVKRVLFLLMDHCLYSAMAGTRMHVVAQSCGGCIVAEFGSYAQELLWRDEGEPPFATPPGSMHRSMQLAERMIAAIGGSLTETRDAAGTRVIVRVPLAVNLYRRNETKTLAS